VPSSATPQITAPRLCIGSAIYKNVAMFRLISTQGRAALQNGQHWHDLAALSGDATLADPMVAIARFAELHHWQQATDGRTPDGTVDPASLDNPVPRPQKVFAIGLNYGRHAAETGAQLPPSPLTFTKFPSCLVGPTADIELSGDTVDWEVELVVVIGTGGRNISRDQAWSHVAGLTLGQDISDRTVQRAGVPPQFSLGKSFDTYGPLGPAIVSVDAFPNPDNIGVWCDVAGERMQDGRTDDLIFDVAHLVSYLSSICTLVPGDIIFTGTPDGVGMARGRFLQAGELIESGAEVIGTLSNRCVASTH
jgi:2-keto-4-pentenoate hydratase/2-oxohepta-3-ene-1,7-dioic acid hydratase in catechol pathway